MRVILIALGLIILSPGVLATEVIYIPAAQRGAEPVLRYVPEDGRDPDLCRTTRPLPGLNMTRELLGVPGCAVGDVATTSLGELVDVVILVDDTRPLSDAVNGRINSMPGRSLTCAMGSGRRVYPSYVVFENAGGPMRILIVGEAMIAAYFREPPVTSEPWMRHLTRIMQRQSGADASPDSGRSPSIDSFAANGIPSGKGLFNLRTLSDLVHDRHKPYKMDHMASRFHDNGLNWFALAAGVAEKCDGGLYTEYLRFGHPNFQTFVWTLNVPGDIDDQLDLMIRGARNVRAAGLIIDIEGAFRGHAAEARQLYSKAREKAAAFEASVGGWPLTVGITVIGFESEALQPFVNADDLLNADYIMPQIYNRKDNLSEASIRARIRVWETTGRGQHVISLAGAHHCEGAGNACGGTRPKSEAEFEESAAPFRETPRRSIGWWTYGFVDMGNHWSTIRNFAVADGSN